VVEQRFCNSVSAFSSCSVRSLDVLSHLANLAEGPSQTRPVPVCTAKLGSKAIARRSLIVSVRIASPSWALTAEHKIESVQPPEPQRRPCVSQLSARHSFDGSEDRSHLECPSGRWACPVVLPNDWGSHCSGFALVEFLLPRVRAMGIGRPSDTR
jgi:hypothetical protein